MSNYVKGCGNPNSKLIVCGEAPGAIEDEQGIPFVGASGALVTKFLQRVGLSREEIWLTNAYKYRPQENDIKRIHEVCDPKLEIKRLWQEINQIDPNVIIALGNTALQELSGKSGISLYRGSILESIQGYPKIVPTYHPANLLHQKGGEMPDYRQKAVIELDFKRAVAQSKFKDFRLPQRTLYAVKSYIELYRFYERYKDNKLLSIDIETSKSIPICIGMAFNSYEGISIPLFNNNSKSELPAVWKLIAEILQNHKIIGQNFKFDEHMLNCLGFYINELYVDTMLLHHTLYPEMPQSLQFMSSILTEEPYYKDEREEYDPEKHKFSFDKLLTYNAKDVCVTYECAEKLLAELKEDPKLEQFFFEFVMKLHSLYKDIDNHGVCIDNSQQLIMLEKYREQRNSNNNELKMILGHSLNVDSPKQVAGVIFDELKLPRRKDVSVDTLVSLLNNQAQNELQRTVIQNVIKGRKINKALGTYITVRTDFDGRMRTSSRITGTETGRTSTSVLKGPVRPLLKKQKPIGLAFQTLTKHGEIGNELGRLFIPDPGYIFIEPDLSQAEARVVSLLSSDYETLQLFDTTDIHTLTATWIFEIEKDKITGEYRFVGKKVRHAGNYDMRKHRCMQVINTEAQKFGIDIQISEWKAGKLLEKFHEHVPKVRNVYHKEIQEALQDKRILINPFGRKREFFARWGDELFREAYATIPQGTVSDHLKISMLRIKDRIPDIRYVRESHDAFMAMVLLSEVHSFCKVFKEELEKPIDFSECTLKRGILKIPCEIKIGENWKDLKTYEINSN